MEFFLFQFDHYVCGVIAGLEAKSQTIISLVANDAGTLYFFPPRKEDGSSIYDILANADCRQLGQALGFPSMPKHVQENIGTVNDFV